MVKLARSISHLASILYDPVVVGGERLLFFPLRSITGVRGKLRRNALIRPIVMPAQR